jgi:hypothetical protein
MLPVKMKPAVPAPERVAVTAVLLTLSTTETAPVELPVVVGANVTFIVQDALALSVPEQLFVWEKGPFTVMLTPRVVVKLFLRSNDWAALVLPTLVLPDVKLVGDSVCSLSSGRIVEATVKAVINRTDGVRLQVDHGNETALVYLWQAGSLVRIVT